MKLFVLDTHIYLAYAQNKVDYLSSLIKTIFKLSERNECIFYIPTISFWEIGYKLLTGEVKIKGYGQEEALKVIQEPLINSSSFRDLQLSRKAASMAPYFRSKLPDPFDQLIVASALEANLPLITKDANIQMSKLVQTVW